MSYLTYKQRETLFEMRSAMDGFVASVVDSPVEINTHMAAIRAWKQGIYAIGDVRMYEGIPYKCVQAHDSTGNPTWNPAATPALWMQYHGTTPETARPWIAPMGSHDMYRAGEYMIWADGTVYICKEDTVYGPDAYSSAWKVV